MWIADQWTDYQLLDTSAGEKLEYWNGYILRRPDPQVIWDTPKNIKQWTSPNARYIRSNKGGGKWEINNLPNDWTIHYKDLSFKIKPMNFKHTGIFPEQAVNWDFVREIVDKSSKQLKVLNLFAYTGGATIAAAKSGANVCHVDAAKGMVAWARENAAINGLSNAPIRWIIDDCEKFLRREIRRGSKYDGIILDPPSYGRGPNGEVWHLEDKIYELLVLCSEVLSDDASFVVFNSYTTGLASSVLSYLINITIKQKFGGVIDCAELGLPVKGTDLVLPCGATARWHK